MIVGMVQYHIEWENPEANFCKIRCLLEQFPPPNEALVLLPEMFATGFSMDKRVPQAYPKCAEFLKTTAKELKIFLGGGIAKAMENTLRNTYVVVSPVGEVLCEYHKAHPFSISEEGRFYTGGEEVVTAEVKEVTVAPTVCYDLRFPELYRRAMQKGAEIMVVAANWPAKRDSHWHALLRARAIENQAYIVGVNRTGEDPNFSYCGSSMVVSPSGKVLFYARETEGIFYCHLDVERLRTYRRKFPVLRDVKPWLIGGNP